MIRLKRHLCVQIFLLALLQCLPIRLGRIPGGGYCHRFAEDECNLPFPEDDWFDESRISGTGKIFSKEKSFPGLNAKKVDLDGGLWPLARMDGFSVSGGMLIETDCDVIIPDYITGKARGSGGMRADPILWIDTTNGASISFRTRIVEGSPCIIHLLPDDPLDLGKTYFILIKDTKTKNGRQAHFSSAFNRLNKSNPLEFSRYLKYLNDFLFYRPQLQFVAEYTTSSTASTLGPLLLLRNNVMFHQDLGLQFIKRVTPQSQSFSHELHFDLNIPSPCAPGNLGECRIYHSNGLPDMGIRMFSVHVKMLIPRKAKSKAAKILLVSPTDSATIEVITKMSQISLFADSGYAIVFVSNDGTWSGLSPIDRMAYETVLPSALERAIKVKLNPKEFRNYTTLLDFKSPWVGFALDDDSSALSLELVANLEKLIITQTRHDSLPETTPEALVKVMQWQSLQYGTYSSLRKSSNGLPGTSPKDVLFIRTLIRTSDSEKTIKFLKD